MKDSVILISVEESSVAISLESDGEYQIQLRTIDENGENNEMWNRYNSPNHRILILYMI